MVLYASLGYRNANVPFFFLLVLTIRIAFQFKSVRLDDGSLFSYSRFVPCLRTSVTLSFGRAPSLASSIACRLQAVGTSVPFYQISADIIGFSFASSPLHSYKTVRFPLRSFNKTDKMQRSIGRKITPTIGYPYRISLQITRICKRKDQ